MCGFCGFLSQYSIPTSRDKTQHIIQRMNEKIAHRGPDDSGNWIDRPTGVVFGHRRLSVMDLSQAGHQPMTSSTGRYVIAFNGEIYNFKDLQQAINTYHPEQQWLGHSDTEVILSAIEYWGLENTLTRLIGMFAFSLWDKQEKTLYLVRDRMGEKPLYFGWQGHYFLFASELKSLREHPAWQGEVDRDVLSSFMRFSYVPAPHSIYKNIYKLTPGSYLKLTQAHKHNRELPQPVSYWSIDQVARTGMQNPYLGTPEKAVDQLEQLLRQSIDHQMIADVPLGAFLSGGIDSSTVVALMQDMSEHPVNTFSIGFQEDRYNEAHYALEVAKHLHTHHTELYVTANQALDVIPHLSSLYDEPFADSSQIPTYLVSQLARKQVTVSLSGDGGDELFGGYERYQYSGNHWQKIHNLPLRKLIGRSLDKLPSFLLNRYFFWAEPYLNGIGTVDSTAKKLKILSNLLSTDNPYDIYKHVQSQWVNPDDIVIGATEASSIFTSVNQYPNFSDLKEGFMYIDQHSYLADDILAKVDRAAMGVSLETRIPLLDHRLVEFAWTLPMSIKMRNNQAKWPLRQVLSQHIPETLIDRPKMGFGVPMDSWLRHDLKPWADDLLNEKRLHAEGFFNPQRIQRMWNEHQKGTRDWQYPLWTILMFQQWHESL